MIFSPSPPPAQKPLPPGTETGRDREEVAFVLKPDIAVNIYCVLTGQCLEGEAKRRRW
jgi:hypothetical protein